MRTIMLRNPNDEEAENWRRFWMSFNAWFSLDALNENYIPDNKRHYNSSFNGGVYEFNIDFEKEYNIEYGESFPIWSNIQSFDDIKKFVEIAYNRWINTDKHYDFTIKVNDMLCKFNLPYKLERGKLNKNGMIYQNANNIDINLRKDELLFSAYNIYKIIKQIGQGGNSKVYEASDEENNHVAIKVVQREKGSKFKRFINEIAFCEKYEHKNIIKIIDRGAIGESFVYYVMPLAKDTLRDRIKNKLHPEDAEEIMINILEGLSFAHLKKTYHRDIKPENILFLDSSNCSVIADFGIAHFCEEDLLVDVQTKSSDRLANFQYAAPEQRVKGNATQIDGRADVYAAGLILNEMFTGNLVAGNNYKKISEDFPEYHYLDCIFEKLYCQQPKDRLYPTESIIAEIYKQKEENS